MSQELTKYPKKTVSSNSCSGCLLQCLGLLFLFAFPVGTIIGILLFIASFSISGKTICGNCGNSIEDTANICPTCKQGII